MSIRGFLGAVRPLRLGPYVFLVLLGLCRVGVFWCGLGSARGVQAVSQLCFFGLINGSSFLVVL